tara:strand:+ start:1319 stop:1621 length:303 start_codon:yes stop_codon:yes gene_type:complete
MNEQEIIKKCMENSYRILTGKKTVDDIFSESTCPYFLWNVMDKKSGIPKERNVFIDVIDTLIEYFEEDEEYERCAELLKLKKKDESKYRRKTRKTNTIRE